MAAPAAPASGLDRIDQTAAMYAAMREDLQKIKDPVELHKRIAGLTAERDALQTELAATRKIQAMRASLAATAPDFDNGLLKAENMQLVSTATRLKIATVSLFAALVAVSGHYYFHHCTCNEKS